MKITVLFPTATEASLFAREEVTTVVSGVGLTATAYATLKAIYQHQPDMLILAGVAGVYPHAAHKIGDVVLVESEVEGDLGFQTPDGFVHLAHLPIDMDFERRHRLYCPHLPAGYPLASVHSLSANTALSPLVDTRDVAIENMEGAAFFHVCLQERQPFLSLRAISNVVQPGHDDWDLAGSVSALTSALHQLIDRLQSDHTS
ncbi:phosphorylase family protein [Leeia oryzae]|uniref:phosphorylase family protein n=1 Tax=Leeia oryzae TaxID=356662 RepID=UPI00035CBF14|nr:hypothetical protein [Leeia oryzae]